MHVLWHESSADVVCLARSLKVFSAGLRYCQGYQHLWLQTDSVFVSCQSRHAPFTTDKQKTSQTEHTILDIPPGWNVDRDDQCSAVSKRLDNAVKRRTDAPGKTKAKDAVQNQVIRCIHCRSATMASNIVFDYRDSMDG